MANYQGRSGGAAVLVMKANEVGYRWSVGNAVTSGAVPITSTTPFRIASMAVPSQVFLRAVLLWSSRSQDGVKLLRHQRGMILLRA